MGGKMENAIAGKLARLASRLEIGLGGILVQVDQLQAILGSARAPYCILIGRVRGAGKARAPLRDSFRGRSPAKIAFMLRALFRAVEKKV